MRPWQAILPATAVALVRAMAVPAHGETDFTSLSARERAIFHDQIRIVLMAYPELARPDPVAPVDLYAEDIANDLALIDANRNALFSPSLPAFGNPESETLVALFVGADCPACDQARATLKALAASHDLRVTLIDAGQHAELADRLGVDTLPFYVFPKMMLRGDMPATVLETYIDRGTGQ